MNLFATKNKPMKKQTVTIRFHKVLHSSTYQPYEIYGHNCTLFSRYENKTFKTLKELKRYFRISDKLTIVDSTYAIGENGTRYTYKVYEAEIPDTFAKNFIGASSTEDVLKWIDELEIPEGKFNKTFFFKNCYIDYLCIDCSQEDFPIKGEEKNDYGWIMSRNYKISGTVGYIHPISHSNIVKRWKTIGGLKRNLKKWFTDMDKSLFQNSNS